VLIVRANSAVESVACLPCACSPSQLAALAAPDPAANPPVAPVENAVDPAPVAVVVPPLIRIISQFASLLCFIEECASL
jgi:hypothetical protein